jgi:hypothetical protein
MYQQVGGGQNSVFENKSPEEMDFDIGAPGAFQTGLDSKDMEFAISGGLILDNESKASLSLVLDTNRMLRFYNQAEIKEVNPGAPSNVSFFFTTVFDQSVYAFAGSPGEIYGFQLITRACTGVADLDIPTDHECQSGGVVAAWLTLITDSAGLPFIAGFMPDDDNTLTVIKGRNVSANGEPYDPSMIAKQPETSLFDIGYALDPATPGTLFNVDLSLPSGSQVPNVWFRGFNQSYGTVNTVRRQ